MTNSQHDDTVRSLRVDRSIVSHTIFEQSLELAGEWDATMRVGGEIALKLRGDPLSRRWVESPQVTRDGSFIGDLRGQAVSSVPSRR
jgi:hypothetical protein